VRRKFAAGALVLGILVAAATALAASASAETRDAGVTAVFDYHDIEEVFDYH
jgi:uncharacterized protein YdaL